MKTIIRPARPEKVQFNCDVTGVLLKDGPVATITLSCGYGAPYDGDTFAIDLSMKAADVVIPLLRALLLDGGPLGPHLTASLLPTVRPDREARISRRERARLLRELEKLLRYRRRVQASVAKGLGGSTGEFQRRKVEKVTDRASIRATVPAESPETKFGK